MSKESLIHSFGINTNLLLRKRDFSGDWADDSGHTFSTGTQFSLGTGSGYYDSLVVALGDYDHYLAVTDPQTNNTNSVHFKWCWLSSSGKVRIASDDQSINYTVSGCNVTCNINEDGNDHITFLQDIPSSVFGVDLIHFYTYSLDGNGAIINQKYYLIRERSLLMHVTGVNTTTRTANLFLYTPESGIDGTGTFYTKDMDIQPVHTFWTPMEVDYPYFIYLNTMNHIPYKVGEGYTDYGNVISNGPALYKIIQPAPVSFESSIEYNGNTYPLKTLDFGLDYVINFRARTSRCGIPTINFSEYVVAVYGFEVLNDTLYVNIYTKDSSPNSITTHSNKKKFAYSGYSNVWLAKDCTGSIDIPNNLLLDYLCMDIVDNDTGEVLVDHKKDSVNLSADSVIHIALGNEYLVRGALYFSDGFECSPAGFDNNLSKIYKSQNIGNAFFPVNKYLNINGSGSIYSGGAFDYGSSQGIALFNTAHLSISLNTPAGIMYTLLSPLNKYALPPKVDDEKLIVYAQHAFTHKIQFNVSENHLDVASNVYYIDDTYTNLNDIIVTARDNIFSNDNIDDIECNNKYYEVNTLLKPASISFYDDKIHITWQASKGTRITVDGTSYDLSTSELSIKMVADLGKLLLPQYFTSGSQNPLTGDPYHITLGDDFATFRTNEVKEIQRSINDISKSRGYIHIDSITPIQDSSSGLVTASVNIDTYMLMYPVITESVGTTHFTMSYTDSFSETAYNNEAQHITFDREYSSESQLFIKQKVKVTSTVSLPDLTGVVFNNNENSIAEISDDGNVAQYDYTNNKITDMIIQGNSVAKADIQLSDVTEYDAYTKYDVVINQAINTDIYFKHVGIYKIVFNDFDNGETHTNINNITYLNGVYTFNGCSFKRSNGTNLTGLDFSFDFNDFEDKTKCKPKYLDYSSTDVRTSKTKYFARVLCDNEYQLIKQQWDSTVETENFWWLDETHILCLTKDEFIVKEKAIEYDDWAGDKWNETKKYNRIDYLNSEADRFLCSSVKGKGAKAYLYILSPVSESMLEVAIYDPLDNMSSYKFTINFEHVALGEQLPLDKCENESFTLYSYSDIIANSVISDSKLSAVELGNKHWLGIQYDNNLNQWSLQLQPQDSGKCIRGYGCIGINGYATGGMLPIKYFNTEITVQPIDALEAETDVDIINIRDFNKFNERIVGDENQQWYISEKLEGIVIAVNLSDTTKQITLPITNKYAQVYSSPSYARYTVHAFGLQIKQLVDLFTNEQAPLWKQIIKYAMFPVVWFLSPYTNIINYLQQTLGQYAYVHYNTTSIGKRRSITSEDQTVDNAGLTEDEGKQHIDALTMDDLSFDVQHIAQEQSFRDNAWDNILGIFMSMVVSATDYSVASLSVNSLQNQSAVSDIGRKFSQAFSQNIGSMSVTGFNMQSTKPMLKSEVTAVKTLDMFYSTSAEQRCFAGPGYVNTQFVAQCTAQSVTSVQLEAQQTQIFILLKELSTWQAKVELYIVDKLSEYLFKQADQQASGPQFGVSTAVGFIVSLVLSASAYALVAAKLMLRLATDTVNSILDSFFPGGIKTNITAQLSRHNYSIEGKHAYGNKSEQFFWPCINCDSKLYTDETVEAILQEKPWPLEMPQTTIGNTQVKKIYSNQPACTTIKPQALYSDEWKTNVDYNIASCKGKQRTVSLQNGIAYVIGTETFLPTVPFKNENIGEGEPVFTPPAIQDYILDKNWNLMITAYRGDAMWVSCKDTKLFDGSYSNVVISDTFCGVACSHTAIEIKPNIQEEYLRPWAVSPDAIAINVTGLNCAYEEKAYHAFDGYGYRITDWLGSSGMNKEHYTLQYCFQVNDRFKRSNKLPPNQFMGNFQAVPNMALDVKDDVFNQIQVTSEEIGMEVGTTGENKDQQRYAIPIFTEHVSTLPAIVKAHSSYKLAVIEGITSLTTGVRTSQTAYKLPVSIDFNINDQLFRMTNEYICSVKHDKGLEQVQYLVPALGLTYLGSTPFMAYFYNQATRQYYIYQGGNTLQAIDMLERFRDIKGGYYDFITQEVVMPCLATFSRLDKQVKDNDTETDNYIIPVFKHNKVSGEVTPPITTIFKDKFRTMSIPAGLVFQGPNRCIINRFVWSDYMLEGIKNNKRRWVKVPREEYHPFRQYYETYKNVNERLNDTTSVVKGWAHNPFLLVTSPIGINEQTDCKFEWEITFAWTVEMEKIFEADEYVTVNVMAETMCPGGKIFSRPTHIFLHKELFTRSDNYGYYSFRYQSNNGSGNRERLHIWSDGYIAISSLQLEYKVVSDKRNEIIVTQEDIKGLKEM